MSLKISFESRGSYLYVSAEGQFDLDTAKQHFLEIIEAVVKHNLDKILFDYRMVEGIEKMTTIERFNYAEYCVQNLNKAMNDGKVPPLRLVYLSKLVRKEDRFSETVAVNRGISVIALDNIEEALEWLGVNQAGKN